MATKRKYHPRMPQDVEEQVLHLYFNEGRSVNNIVKTQNIGWGVAAISRVVKEAKRRTAEKQKARRSLAVLTDEEWTNMMTDYGNEYPYKLRISRAKQAELKELRAIRTLLEHMVDLLEKKNNG